MPQWQGGDEPAYSFGSELLRWLAPPHDGPEETVAVPEPDGSSPPVSRGIKWCAALLRSEEHTSELQSLMRLSYAVFCLKKKKTPVHQANSIHTQALTTDKNTIQ